MKAYAELETDTPGHIMGISPKKQANQKANETPAEEKERVAEGPVKTFLLDIFNFVMDHTLVAIGFVITFCGITWYSKRQKNAMEESIQRNITEYSQDSQPFNVKKII